MTRRMPNLPPKKRLRLEGEVPEASSPVIGTVEGGSSGRKALQKKAARPRIVRMQSIMFLSGNEGGRRSDSSHEQLVPSFQRGRGGGRGRGRGYASAIRFPPRPLGTVGKRCLVRANHFIVEVEDKDFHHHDVSIDPVVHNKKTSREILGVLVKQYWESHLGRRRPAYDGRKSLYTAGPLPFNNKVFPVKLVENDEAAGSSSQSRRKEREFKVTISLVARIDLDHLQQFIQGRQLDCPQEIMQVLGAILRASPSEK
ncbi:protein argonaute 1-like [Syzygium oleosum]|uniref:protein argonaute 1-like n=1 Tax=Syzygium oleosum TaxID=219896 RepID=UPI0024BAFF4A|nr:protein argonaute 1-like [Syzygium oleosum]